MFSGGKKTKKAARLIPGVVCAVRMPLPGTAPAAEGERGRVPAAPQARLTWSRCACHPKAREGPEAAGDSGCLLAGLRRPKDRRQSQRAAQLCSPQAPQHVPLPLQSVVSLNCMAVVEIKRVSAPEQDSCRGQSAWAERFSRPSGAALRPEPRCTGRAGGLSGQLAGPGEHWVGGS